MKFLILTPFASWDDAYALCKVARQQANALADAGHEVVFVVQVNATDRPPRLSQDVRLVRGFECLTNTTPDQPTQENVDLRRREIAALVNEHQPDAVLTHDLLFQSSFIDFAEAIHQMPLTRKPAWLHMCHSGAPPAGRAAAGAKARRSLPQGHYLVSLGQNHQHDLAAHYRTQIENIHICPNPNDVLEYEDELAVTMAKDLNLLARDIVQVYPVCGTRFGSKGMGHLIEIFECLKELGQNVCLLVCNSHSNNDASRAAVAEFMEQSDLDETELVFTSHRLPVHEGGVPHRTVMSLMRLSNLFVFPSRIEACSLALSEAQGMGLLTVLNRNCPAQTNYASPNCLVADFDGWNFNAEYASEIRTVVKDHETGIERAHTERLTGDKARKTAFMQLASNIIRAIDFNPCLAAKRYAHQTYRPQAIATRLADIARISIQRNMEQ
jgi:glycosyltransferase involved in cell wall biosynthesis